VDVVADDFQMLDARPTGESGSPRPAAAPAAELPEYEYNAADEEVPF
jgi:hypothetical protein